MPRSPLPCLLALAAGCAPAAALAPAHRARLTAPPEAHGALVYDGAVHVDDASAPRFRYQRRVRTDGDGLVSTHLTHDDRETPIVLQRAWHDAGYRLRRFSEVHAKTGVVAEVRVDAEGALHFETTRGEARAARTEAPGPPVVVGPTLFGFVLAHRAALQAGAILDVRFAAADQARSFAFQLVSSPDEPHVVLFRPASAWLRLFVREMRIELDPRADRVRRYVGRIPPRSPSLGALEARVEYTPRAPRYR